MTEKLVARLKPDQKVELIKGEEKNIFVQIVNATTGDLYDLSEATEIVVSLKSLTGVLSKTLTDSLEIETDGGVAIVEALKGEIKFNLSEADTTSLKESDAASIEILIEEDDITKIVQIHKMISIRPRLA